MKQTDPKTTSLKGAHKRRHMRFKPGPTTMAFVNFTRGGQSDYGRRFEGEHVALVESESIVGCGLVFVSEKSPKTSQKLWVKVGEIDPLPAIVRWVKELGVGIFHVGVEYQDGAFQEKK